MKRISVELVPRDEQVLRASLSLVKSLSEQGAQIDVINIPDLLRLEIRSYEGAALAQEYFPNTMPHIRAMDIDLSRPLPMKAYLREHHIQEVLVIEGDLPQDMNHIVYPTTTTDVIRKFHAEMPEMKVYAGIDQYRGSASQELYRIERKLQAGVDGFFTQPFFDLRLLGIYADMLSGQEVYWGITPVLTARSKSYWERKNHVVFPKHFAPTLAWSLQFAHEVMEAVDRLGGNLYVMPIKTNLEACLKGIFTK